MNTYTPWVGLRGLRRVPWRRADTGAKNAALTAIAERLSDRREQLFEANRTDLSRGAQESIWLTALLDRLELTRESLEAMADGLLQVAGLADPIGEISAMNYRPTGIQVGRMRVPLGVVGIIYESRPNVTADAAGLCIKSGNAVILRGEARRQSIPTWLLLSALVDGLRSRRLAR